MVKIIKQNICPDLCSLCHLQYLQILQNTSTRLSSTWLYVLPTNNYFETMSVGLELCGLQKHKATFQRFSIKKHSFKE